MDATAAQPTAKVIEKPFGPFERMLAIRYLGAKREHGGLAFISVVSVVGITLGVWALILTMSIMNGFRLELISKMVGFEPHAFIDTRGLPQPQVDALMDEVRMEPGVVTVEPMAEGVALVTSAIGRSDVVQVRGVRPEDLRANRMVADSIAKGAAMRAMPEEQKPENWWRTPLGDGSIDRFGDTGAMSDDIVLGDMFANMIGVGVGDTIKLTQANGASTMVGTTVRSRTFRVSAIFHVGSERYDRGIAFLPIEAAKAYFGFDEGYPEVGVRLTSPDDDVRFASDVMAKKAVSVSGWTQRSAQYVSALIVERNVMRLILFIVVVITALNIITGVLMLVKNKARDVAILRTIGATRSGVVRIFMMSGTFLGMAGVGTGVLLGIVCALNIADIQHFVEDIVRIFNPSFEGLFPASIYQLDALPAQLEWGEVAWVGGAAFVVTLLMSVIPAMWAGRLNPVEALRFE